MADEPDRRSDPRVPTNLQLEVADGETIFIPGHAADLSLSGVRVACVGRLPIGATCHVRFLDEATGDPLLELEARVARHTDDAMGLAFVDLDEDTAGALQAFKRWGPVDLAVSRREGR